MVFQARGLTSLNGINERGVVVGRYTDPSTGIDHGILLKVKERQRWCNAAPGATLRAGASVA